MTASEDEVDYLTARELLTVAQRGLRSGADPEFVDIRCRRALSLWRIMICAPLLQGDVSAGLAAFGRCRDAFGSAGLDLPATLARLHRPLLDNDTAIVRDLLRVG